MSGTTEAFARVEIDALLTDASWDLTDGSSVLFEHALPDGTQADYVLCDRQGRPMAALEAKRAGIDPIAARDQGRHYAEQLDVPFVFLSNGKEVMNQSREKSVYDILGRDPVHPFPARMAPGLALEVIAEYRRPLRILDPMSGSGTVLAVAHSKGHRAVGVDVDPLAVLISRVWTTAVNVKTVQDMAETVLEHARHMFASLPTRDAYPRDADSETRQFARYWFDGYARRQLASLATAIEQVRDNTIREALWCAFSRLIISKQSGASLAMDLSHSRPHRKFKRAPTKPFRKFLSAVERVTTNSIDASSQSPGPVAQVYEGDARHLDLSDSSIDLVITSPPYLNAIDYLRCSKFSLVWMGYSVSEVRRLRATTVGTEIGLDARDDQEIQKILSALKLRPKLQTRQEAMLARYINDMQRAVGETSRVLSANRKAVYVVGENTIRGTFVRNAMIVEAIANSTGLRCTARRSRELPANRRYLPPPSNQSDMAKLDNRLRREVILTFQKAA